MPPRTKVWSLDDHTRGKHMVLKSYLDAWLPIILSRYERALFVDAFAGPGEYKKREPGSPVIAIRSLAEHVHQDMMTGEMHYMFIEKDTRRATHLKNIIDREKARVPSICHITSLNDTFEGAFPELVKFLDSNSIPAFVMIDPFGVSGVSMEQIKTLMKYPSTEVYISFMYEWINRFASQSEFANPLDGLFGCSDWKRALNMSDSTSRRTFFHDLYQYQLKQAGANYVLPFELHAGYRHVYTLFFATQSSQGCDKMKQAMWKVAPFGDFQFKGGMHSQLTLGPEILDFSSLKDDLRDEFRLNKYISIESIDQFMRSDKTAFHTSHHRRVLAEMEREGMLEIKKGDRKRRRGTYPDGTILRFVAPPPPPPTQGRMI